MRGSSAHFERRLKSPAGVQIALKHVHDIEWLICIKKEEKVEGWRDERRSGRGD